MKAKTRRLWVGLVVVALLGTFVLLVGGRDLFNWIDGPGRLGPESEPHGEIVLQAVQQRDITDLVGITSTGQATKANSFPVVVASDQGLSVTVSDPTMYATVLVSQTVTTTVTSDAMLTPWEAKGAYLTWDLAVVPGSNPTITLYVDLYDQVQADYTCIYQTDAQTTATPKKVLMYPGATDTDSQLLEVCQLPLPHRWRVRVIPSVPGGSWSYSVAASYIP